MSSLVVKGCTHRDQIFFSSLPVIRDFYDLILVRAHFYSEVCSYVRINLLRMTRGVCLTKAEQL